MTRNTRFSVLRHPARLLALSGLLWILWWTAGWVAYPQEDTLEFIISETGATQIPLALPDFRHAPRGSPAALRAAQTIHEVLRNDLDFSGYFLIVDPDYYRLVNTFNEQDPRFRDWVEIGADSLILGNVEERSQNLVVEGRLYEVQEELLRLGKRYRGRLEDIRGIAHRFADEVVRQFTGEKGVAATRLTFVSQVGSAKEISIMDYDGEHRMQLTRDRTLNLSPAWSPDGLRIAFVSYRKNDPEVVILSQDGSLERAFPQAGELNSAPDWSPDGKQLAFTSSRDGNAEIYKVEGRTGRLRRLTNHPSIDTSPAWSPTGREILFTSDRSGSPQLYMMDAEGGNIRRLTFEGQYNDLGAWSPRGDRFAFSSRIKGRFEVLVHHIRDQKTQRLTHGEGSNESPTWAPDGRHLAFSSNRTGRYEIYTMDLQGKRVRRITHNGGNTAPDWSR